VFGLNALDLQYMLLVPDGVNISALLAVEGGVWACVNCEIVGWLCGA
jgi:hypothetical protein